MNMTCPECGRRYSDENMYCYHDGAALLADRSEGRETASGILTGLPADIESPIQQKLFYPLAGVLIAAIGLIGVLVFDRYRVDFSQSAQVPNTSQEPRPARRDIPNDLSPRSSESVAVTASQPSNNEPIVDLQADEQAIRSRLERWRMAGEGRDPNQVGESYANSVDYYARRNASRSFVVLDKSRAYVRYSSIGLVLNVISINVNPDGQNAQVVIDKEWSFSGNGTSRGKVRQELRLKKIEGDWLINGEKDIHVYYKHS